MILALSLDVKALAVASDFLESGILTLVEETSTIYSIRLQNPDSGESRVKVDYDKEFMKALEFKEEYILPPESSTRIEFNITAPKYNKNNDLFKMSFTVHQLSGGGGGGIPFLLKINKQFKLKVIKDPNRFHIDFFIVAYAIVFLAIFFFLYKKRKPRRKRKLNRKIIK